MARILLGVSGGIAAYKALELARLATKAGHGVRVVMTPTAHRFVGAASFEGIDGAPDRRAGDERQDVRGCGDPGEPRDAALACHQGDRARGRSPGLSRRARS